MAVVTFPSREFFEAMARLMRERLARFQHLGVIDTSFVVCVRCDAGLPEDRAFRLTFETHECVGVQDGEGDDAAVPDFAIEGPYSAWKEWIEALRERPTEARSLSALIHHDDPLRATYTDPVRYEALFRYQASIQEFFSLAREMEVAYV